MCGDEQVGANQRDKCEIERGREAMYGVVDLLPCFDLAYCLVKGPRRENSSLVGSQRYVVSSASLAGLAGLGRLARLVDCECMVE